jgi:hypothetical protein
LIEDRWEVSIHGAQIDRAPIESDQAPGTQAPGKKVRAIALAAVDGAGAIGPPTILAIE